MLRLSRIFALVFVDEEITPARLRRGAEDHLERLAAEQARAPFGPTGQTAIHIAQTETALTAAGGALSSEATVEAVKESRRVATLELFATIRARVSRREGRIKDLFGKGSAGYTLVFPDGLQAWSDANFTTLPQLLAAFIAALASHGEVVTDLHAEFLDLSAQWTSVRGAQLDAKGQAIAADEGAEIALRALAIQLQRNWLYLATVFIGQEDKAELFFNQSLFELADPEEEEEEPGSGGGSEGSGSGTPP